ncbi:hypothetical protein ACQP2T_52200 [Nonomuraea sp. CA-143628]|uniref:hypothetical protein n=1 Tax=Nonomuraea sp. CA-143628 TaxID=3239997 RepID=UPI003D8E2D95
MRLRAGTLYATLDGLQTEGLVSFALPYGVVVWLTWRGRGGVAGVYAGGFPGAGYLANAVALGVWRRWCWG